MMMVMMIIILMIIITDECLSLGKRETVRCIRSTDGRAESRLPRVLLRAPPPGQNTYNTSLGSTKNLAPKLTSPAIPQRLYEQR